MKNSFTVYENNFSIKSYFTLNTLFLAPRICIDMVFPYRSEADLKSIYGRGEGNKCKQTRRKRETAIFKVE